MPKTTQSLQRERGAAFDLLSDREREVLHLAAAGFLDKQIGQELGLSLNTLRTYWSRIRVKLGDASRAALVVAYASTQLGQVDQSEEYLVQHEGWVWDVRKKTLIASDSINDLHGLQRGVPHPVSFYSRLYHPEDRVSARKALYDVAEGRLGIHTITFRLVTESDVQLVSLCLRPIKNKEGEVVKVIGYRTRALDCRPDHNCQVRLGFFFHNLDTGEFWADDQCCRIYQLDPSMASNRSAFVERHQQLERSVVEDLVTEAAKSGESYPEIESQLLLPDGSKTWVQLRLRIRKDRSGHTHVYETVLAFD